MKRRYGEEGMGRIRGGGYEEEEEGMRRRV